MSNNTKLAEVLGLHRGQTSTGELPEWYYYHDGTAACVSTESELKRYLDSPATEKAVRDRVRELWCIKGNSQREHGHDRVVTLDIYPVGDYNHPFDLSLCEDHNTKFDMDADTEAEAFAAALLWLA